MRTASNPPSSLPASFGGCVALALPLAACGGDDDTGRPGALFTIGFAAGDPSVEGDEIASLLGDPAKLYDCG